MANATATISDGFCYIMLPSTVTWVSVQPRIPGNPSWQNICTWRNDSHQQTLGIWTANAKFLRVISNPFGLIDTYTMAGVLSLGTDPPVSQATQLSLEFQNAGDKNLRQDFLKLEVINIDDNLTEIKIKAEDGGDDDFSDFNMVIIVKDKSISKSII